ncbi:FtsQ-type POTRA domain-containing protein [Aeromicrobium sp. 636]|uniref:FtsQ-type POTRA domain-containing protein n=1 Tax=Aeromicrobium senzhongii TaxID=2663859 RepID=A0A8I0JZM2_9ACTN|nr:MULTISPECIES: FtsQ-type POTRA domain-containing protein [Aeromicrobium]MBC9225441.1 FtsQ-type POTRA domain-containing protein [Aeromicrobium senzhongii]MCQ3997551.1 FtsQ-type POTRA domain-containing protein [Aeromicrobium sp. 636]MTB87477.1 FtsQ-type POTRA domain-containing protein [Aeromicrobium senzhongii]QNL95473.1 FtsQ-type POTRA domain-containing protein [Aeromicrobium senzhongii]
MSDRFTEKLRQRRRRSRWRIAGVVAAVLALVAAGWAVWFSSLLEARTVEVTGVEHLPAEWVVRSAQVPLGTPVPRIDTDAVAERVATLKPVESVRIERDLPHTIRIVVTERSAVAWVDRSGTPWAVDESGIAYRPLNSRPTHLPRLDVDVDDREVVAAVARVAADIADGDRELLGDTDVIRAETTDSIELALTKRRTVVWGSAEQARPKLAVLRPLLQIKARSYDVSAPERPTTLK